MDGKDAPLALSNLADRCSHDVPWRLGFLPLVTLGGQDRLVRRGLLLVWRYDRAALLVGLGLLQGQAMTTDELAIRAYAESDEAQVIQLWRDVFPDNPAWNVPQADIQRKLAVQRDLFLVGDLRGEIVGTVMAGFDGHRGWVHLVAVAPRHRQRGFGRALMTEAERRLRDIGCTKINLQVRATNQGVISFYESLGYAVEERVSMGKRLS
jgi:ribosomal protein S18 acetylase RimI-like enzyme